MLVPKNILVTFDLKTGPTYEEGRKRIYEILDGKGLKKYLPNRSVNTELPDTVVFGVVTIEEDKTADGVCEGLWALFNQQNIPVSHLLVAFVDSVSAEALAQDTP